MLFENIALLTLKTSSLAWTVEMTGELVTFVLLACFVGLANLEGRFPKIKWSAAQIKQSYRTNVGLFMFNSVLLSICSVSSLYLIAEHFSSHGLLSDMPNNAIKLGLALLAFDLLLYGWHRLSHSVDLLWFVHRVHHNDPYLNVSTAFRLHFVEAVLMNSLKALLIVLLGIDKILVLLIEAFSTLCIMFHHANTSFRFERVLGKVMVVPYLHRVHHSTERCEHDNNYGAVFSIWDRLFGSLLEVEPTSIGIRGNSPKDMLNLIKFGLGLYVPKPVVQQQINLEHMIAEAAYYKAEKRNFRPGDDLRDWLEAKAEILNQVYGKKYRQMNCM